MESIFIATTQSKQLLNLRWLLIFNPRKKIGSRLPVHTEILLSVGWVISLLNLPLANLHQCHCMMAGDVIGAENMLRDFVNSTLDGEEPMSVPCTRQPWINRYWWARCGFIPRWLADYDQIKKVDNWMVTVFTEFKNLL